MAKKHDPKDNAPKPDQAPTSEQGESAPEEVPPIGVWTRLAYLTPNGPRPAVVEQVHPDGTVDITWFDLGVPQGLQRVSVVPVELATGGACVRIPA